jgi:adenosylmethionine-8-amino-7-oxononanoate aminotransferase
VTLCRDELYREFISIDHSKTFFHGHTYTANPIACAVALASLDLTMSEECRASRKRIGEAQARFVDVLWECHGVRDARSLGTILAFDVVTSDSGGYTNSFAQNVRDYFIDQGVLLRPLGNVVYFMPPYSFTDDELFQTYTAIEELCVGL